MADERKPMFHGDSQDGYEWVNLPKVGEPEIELTFEHRKKIEDPNNERNFKSKTQNYGYYYIVYCKGNKKFSLSTWKLLIALGDAQIYEGDTAIIGHPSHGVWTVKLKTVADIPKNDAGDLDYLKKIENSHKSDEFLDETIEKDVKWGE